MSAALLDNLDPLPGLPADQCGHVFEQLGLDLSETARIFLDGVFTASPYLARLAQRRTMTLEALTTLDADTAFEQALMAVYRAGEEAGSVEELDRRLRHAKLDMHLIAGLADLAGEWPVMELTRAITAFADAAVRAALLAHIRFGAEAGRFHVPDEPDNPLPGLMVFALGKMGAGELNYSSDIDLVVFYDPQGLSMPAPEDARHRLPRLLQAVAKSLNDITADGYVFRTDLRLRPDPGATSVALSTDAALHYYENLGMTWERAAWIKARTCAGDTAAGARFLQHMKPFIWRRTLDYAAIDDIRGLARQIQTVGRRAETFAAGHDLKLGRGGIREIEFYAQIPQLVFGGRDKAVRTPATLDALDALAESGAINAASVPSLREDYLLLRAWEHRIQMRQDEQTQTLPEDPAQRALIAAMAGYADPLDFDAEVEALLRRVHGHFSDQFAAEGSRSSKAGSLVLTGVEPTPDTLKTLSKLQFEDPGQIWKQLNNWSAGRVRAMRSPRARGLFAALAPRLVDMMSATGEPDRAFNRFASFFENLPFGVQPLSLLLNESGLAQDLIGIITISPKLATDLARRPELIDAMLDARFSDAVETDARGSFEQRLGELIRQDPSFEAALNSTRRLVREERLRIGMQLLRGRLPAEEAALAFSYVADASIARLAEIARQACEDKHGAMPGQFAIIGMGKLGGRELSASSDLDIVVVYEGEITTQTWFTRFTQRLVSALSVPTEEGELYEVDMQLRPSGKAGPVAVQAARFASYYENEAWTWELMALTRARVIAGDATLGAWLTREIDRVLKRDRAAATILADARDMRLRLDRAKPARTPWALKSRPGGLQDIEFIAQTLQLVHMHALSQPQSRTVDALESLESAGVLERRDARELCDALALYTELLQVIRLTHGSEFDADAASLACIDRLTATAGSRDLNALLSEISKRSKRVRGLYNKYLQDSLDWSDGKPPHMR